ncbi:MAG: molybdopterin-binding protein [Candidatus Limnocylindrales bacterium]
MTMRAVPLEEAIGRRAACDVTAVTPGSVRSILTRGSVVRAADLPALRDAGHQVLYVQDDDTREGTGEVEEGPTSLAIAQVVGGPGLRIEPAEAGKTFLFAAADGLVRVDPDVCEQVNDSDLVLLTTRAPESVVSAGQLVAVVDTIPLTVPEERLAALVEALRARGQAVQVAPFAPLAAALLITGTEIHEGRIPDAVEPVVRDKLARFGGRLEQVEILPDDEERIAAAIRTACDGHDLVIVTGGMSVDPTDRTPAAISSVAETVLKYGIPVLPTSMNLVARRGAATILGVSSGLVHYRSANILDLLLPPLFARVPLTRPYLVRLGAGGLMPAFSSGVEHRREASREAQVR